MTARDDIDIPFDQDPRPIQGPVYATTPELRALGYDVVVVMIDPNDVETEAELIAWRPQLPEDLDPVEGWFLAGKRWEHNSTGFDDESGEHDWDYMPVAVWACAAR